MYLVTFIYEFPLRIVMNNDNVTVPLVLSENYCQLNR